MAFTPTLRLNKVTDEMLAAAGRSLDEVAEEFINFFQKNSIRENLDFTAEKIEIIETGEIIENFNALVVGTFTRGDILHLQLATGDVVAIELIHA